MEGENEGEKREMLGPSQPGSHQTDTELDIQNEREKKKAPRKT